MTQTSTDRIEKQIELNASVSRVWRAITDYQEFSQWFGVDLELPFVVGQPTHGRITCEGYDHLIMEVTVVDMVSEKLFSFNWHPYAVDPNVDYSSEPATLVEFRLEPAEQGTLLTVVESGFDALPKHRRDEAYRMNDGGWTAQMTNIEKYVQNN